MAEPAIGRVGIIISGLGAGLDDPDRPRGKQIRCNGCRSWYPAKHVSCPGCEHARPGFNVGIRTAQLNSALHDQARMERTPIRKRPGYRRVLRAAREQVAKHGPHAFLRP